MGNVKPSRTLVGQTSDSEQETSAGQNGAYHGGQGFATKMPLIKAGSQLGDIYSQNQSHKIPKEMVKK
jgi:hypothetical protein